MFVGGMACSLGKHLPRGGNITADGVSLESNCVACANILLLNFNDPSEAVSAIKPVKPFNWALGTPLGGRSNTTAGTHSFYVISNGI